MNDRESIPNGGKKSFSLPAVWKEHKLKILLAVFAVLALIIGLLQCASRPKYDLFLLYAGPQYIDGSTYRKILSSVSSLCAGDGTDPGIAFDRITYVPGRLAETYQQSGTYYNGARNAEAEETFRYTLAAGEYCILLLDRELYDSVSELGVFVKLPDSVKEETRYDDHALRLSALPLGKKDGLSSLPEDTLLVLRDQSFLQSLLTNKETRRLTYEKQVEYFDLLAGIDRP